MNLTTDVGSVPSVQLTCWQSILASSTTSKTTSEIVAIIFLALINLANISCSLGCIIVVAITPKLHKTAWFLRASMATKDVVLSSIMGGFAMWNIVGRDDTLSLKTMNPIIFVCSVIYITCFAASFVHIMVLSFDRHQVIARPFRYHTGELLPPKVAAILIGSGWTFCFVIGLSVTSQSVEQSERDGNVNTNGCLVPVNKRAKERKVQLLTGIGIPEPLQSRNNSVCHVTNKSRAAQSTVVEDSNDDSETDANEFLLNGGFGKGLLPNPALWGSEDTKPEITILTPVNYRPSILRRIKDTWALYSTLFCAVCFTITNLIPFFVLIVFNPPNYTTVTDTDSSIKHFIIPSSYCITCVVLELLLAGQGIANVIIYIITDDEFRPAILKPFRAIGCGKNYRHRRKYSIDRRRSRVGSGIEYSGDATRINPENT